MTDTQREAFEDGRWYWVRYEGLGQTYDAPALYRANAQAFYSHQFSGVPAREVIVLSALTQPQAQQDRLVGVLRAERDHARAVNEKLVKTLVSIHTVMNPAPVEHEGKTFRFNNPHANEALQALSDQIRAIPEEVQKYGLAQQAAAVPAGWREFIENIATAGSEPLNSLAGGSDKASRRHWLGVIRDKARDLLSSAPAAPQSDDELLAQALGALQYHTEQTRPIERTRLAIEAIDRRLHGGITGGEEPTP